MFSLLLIASASACMTDSQCNPSSLIEDALTGDFVALPDTQCCFLNKCTDLDSIECSAGRYQAYEFLRENVNSYHDAAVIATWIDQECDESDQNCGDILLKVYEKLVAQRTEAPIESVTQLSAESPSRIINQSTPAQALGYLLLVSMVGVAFITKMEANKNKPTSEGDQDQFSRV